MRTERQIEASRANGGRSRGPVTPEGKRNSSANAIKHGLLADTIVLEGELEERFHEVLDDIENELQPETPIEHTLVEKMAVARWRQLRLWGMEKAAMEYQIRQQADSVGRGENNATRASLAFCTLGGDSRSLDLIIRYDALCDRQYLRAHRRFLDIRRHRDGKTNEPLKPAFESEMTTETQDPPSGSAGEPFIPEPATAEPSTHEPSTHEPFSPEPFFPDPPAPDQSPEPGKNQPNEPNNPLKTLEPAAQNPTPPTACRSTHAYKNRLQTPSRGDCATPHRSIRPVPPAQRTAAHRLQLQLRKRLRSPSAR
jgi:hypothetical protein